MERFLLKVESPGVKLDPTSTATSLSGKTLRTTPSTVCNPLFANASQQLDGSGAVQAFLATHQPVNAEPLAFEARMEDAALASQLPTRAELDAFCLDDAVLASIPLP
jgi:hypothetical protein